MNRPLPVIILTAILLASGCASSPKHVPTTQPYILPKNVAQPRLREILDYLVEHGFDEADNVSLFQFSVWVMYDQLWWEDLLRKPCFEAATFNHDAARITVGVSPIKAYHSDGKEPQRLTPLNPEDPAKPQGLSIALEGRRWCVKYTMAGGSPDLEKQLTQLLQTYAHDFARRIDADESLRSQPATPLGQPPLDLQW